MGELTASRRCRIALVAMVALATIGSSGAGTAPCRVLETPDGPVEICHQDLVFAPIESEDQQRSMLGQVTRRGEYLVGSELVEQLADDAAGYRWHVMDDSMFAGLGPPAQLDGEIVGNIDHIVVELELRAADCSAIFGRQDYGYTPPAQLVVDGETFAPDAVSELKDDCRMAAPEEYYERWRYEFADIGRLEGAALTHTLQVKLTTTRRYDDVAVGSASFPTTLVVNPTCLPDVADYYYFSSDGSPTLPDC